MGKADEIREFILKDLRKNMHEREREHRRTGFPITRAVVDKVFDETEQEVLRDRDQWEEEGLHGGIAFVERILRDPEARSQYYRRYGC